MSEFQSQVLELGQKGRVRPRKIEVIRPARIVIGEYIGEHKNTGEVVATVGNQLEYFELAVPGGHWFRDVCGSPCMDMTIPFPRTTPQHGDIIAFERPQDPIDRVLYWGFAANLFDVVAKDFDEDEVVDLCFSVPECTGFYLRCDFGPMEIWNFLLATRLAKTSF